MLKLAPLRRVSFMRALVVRLWYFCFPLVFLGVAMAIGVAIAGQARNPDRLGAGWLVPAVMVAVVAVGLVRQRLKEKRAAVGVVVTGYVTSHAPLSKKYCRWLFEAEGDRLVLTSTSGPAGHTSVALTDLVVFYSRAGRPEWVDVLSSGGRFYFPVTRRPRLTLAQVGFAEADSA